MPRKGYQKIHDRSAYEWSPAEMRLVKGLVKSGYTPREIAARIDRTISAVYGFLNRDQRKKPLIKIQEDQSYKEKTKPINEVIAKLGWRYEYRTSEEYGNKAGHYVDGIWVPTQEVFRKAGIPIPM